MLLLGGRRARLVLLVLLLRYSGTLRPPSWRTWTLLLGRCLLPLLLLWRDPSTVLLLRCTVLLWSSAAICGRCCRPLLLLWRCQLPGGGTSPPTRHILIIAQASLLLPSPHVTLPLLKRVTLRLAPRHAALKWTAEKWIKPAPVPRA